MGQYHQVFNLDKKQKIHPHRFGDGMKLHEFCGGGGTMLALSYLLASSVDRGGGDWEKHGPLSGSWAGDRIAIIGDYSESDDIKGADAKAIYEDESFKDISNAVRDEFAECATLPGH